jgi:voltage-gated potassium channel
VIREELGRLWGWEDRHRRLVARVVLALGLTLLMDIVCTALVYVFERHASGGDIHTLGDALFFTTVQLLTVSSQIKNPLTTAGRIVDVVLEIWALFVVTALAGSFASFFGNADPG